MAKYSNKTREGKCIFCEVAKGNVKFAGLFYEDKDYMAFLSGFPNTEGVTVVMPKRHFPSDVLSLPDNELQKLIIMTKKVSKILLTHYKDVGRIGVVAEGTGVDHAHIKLYPLHGTQSLKIGKWKQYLDAKEEYNKKYTGYITSIEGPRADDKKLKALAGKLKKIKV